MLDSRQFDTSTAVIVDSIIEQAQIWLKTTDGDIYQATKLMAAFRISAHPDLNVTDLHIAISILAIRLALNTQLPTSSKYATTECIEIRK